MTTLMITIVSFILGIDDVSTKLFRRPLLIAPIIGFILGDLQAGLAIGATLEIMWMGIGNVGAYMAPDIITGTLISTSLAIVSRGDASLEATVATAVTLAVPTALLAQQLLVLIESVNCSLNSWAARLAENADVKGTVWLIYPPAILTGLARALPTFIALQFGAGAVQQLVDALPEVVIGGLSVAGKIIPTVGIALLMMAMIKKVEFWLFLILGFVLASYLKFAILPITLIALVIAYLYDLATSRVVAVNGATQSIDEEDYDI